ncbi:MAG: GNAT family N-acetyltransferase [Pseudomonadota bacterium]
MTDVNIRPARAGDVPGLTDIVGRTGLFPAEMLAPMIAPALDGQEGGFWLVAERDDQPLGFAYTAPEAMTEGVWNMLALAVLPGAQRGGVGAQLVQGVEAHLGSQEARLVLVDTSSGPDFEAARQFYENRGYGLEARIRDYWGAGDDKLTYRKAFPAPMP